MRTSSSVASAAAITSGLPLNVPCWRDAAVGDERGELVGHADRAAGQAAADRLGEADDVGRDAEQLGRAARGDGRAGLDLVEDQHRAVVARELAHALEVAVDRAGRC